MIRRIVRFGCRGRSLFGTLDEASGYTGLLIVSGGNEVRGGPWGSQAWLAARVAAAGFPVLRFDRRGVGDSEGENTGFRGSAPDIAAALATFRAELPALRKVVGFGNCDAASALMLERGADCDALVLANPWTILDEAAPAPAAVRAHYRQRLRDPRALLRLLSGKVSLRGLLGSLRRAGAVAPPNLLAAEMKAGLAAFAGPAKILLAERDRTAQAFHGEWDKSDPRLRRCAGATHSFVEPEARVWLEEQVLSALRGT
jgi:exosortase A-associated hydrolase 1